MAIAADEQDHGQVQALFEHIQGSCKTLDVKTDRRGGIFRLVFTAKRTADPVDCVCDMLQAITGVDLRRTRRKGTITPIRHVAMYLLYQRHGYSYHKAAEAMGLRSHAAALKACRKMQGQNVQGNLEQVTRRLLQG